MNQRERFPLKMIKKATSCINNFDKKAYLEFINTFSSIKPAKINASDVFLFNKAILDKISKTQVNRIICNGLLFLLPSTLLQVDQIFSILLKLSDQKEINGNFKRAIIHLRHTISLNSNSLNEFAAIFSQQKSSWIHFLVLDTLLNKIDSIDLKKSIMSAFVNIASNLEKENLVLLSPFISSIPPNLFFQYVRPFLDTSMLRNNEKIASLLPYFIIPLHFSIICLPKTSVSNFVETLSDMCASNDEKLSKESSSILGKIAPYISAKCIKMNSQSVIALFSSIGPSINGIRIAFDQLSNNDLNNIARQSIKMYLIQCSLDSAINNKFNFAEFAERWIISENDLLSLYFAIDYMEDKEKIVSLLKQKDDFIAKAVLFKIGQYKISEEDFSDTFTEQSCKEMNKYDVLMYTDVLSRMKDSDPDYFVSSILSLLNFGDYRSIVLDSIRKCISSKPNMKIVNGIINFYNFIKPKELLGFEIPLQDLEKLGIPQKSIAIAAGYPLKDDDPSIITYLFDIREKYWRTEVNEAILMLASREKSHKQIVYEIMKRKDEWNMNYTALIVGIINHFNIETDSQLIKEVFHKEFVNVPQNFCVKILEKIPRLKRNMVLFVEIFKSLSKITMYPRNSIYSLYSLKDFGEFDFVLFYPTMKYLLSEKDYIASDISKIIGRFSYLDFNHMDIFEEMIRNGEEESLTEFLLVGNQKTLDENAIALKISESQKMANKAFEIINKNPEKFKDTSISCVITIYNLYSSCLPDFSKYLQIMTKFNTDYKIETSKAIAIALESFSPYKENFSSNVISIINNSLNSVEIFSYLKSYMGMEKEIGEYIFSLESHQYNPIHFNDACLHKLTANYPDMIIDFFFSKPNFSHVKKEMLVCLESAILSSKQDAVSLIKRIEHYSNGDINDSTIIELLRCFDLLYRSNVKDVEEHSNYILNNILEENSNIVALNFHYSNIEDKERILRTLMTEEDNKKGLEIFKYIFLSPLEKSGAKNLLQELFNYCDHPNSAIVQSANGTLFSAASSLGKNTLNSILPSVIALIANQLSKRSEIALVNVLQTIGKRFPDILLSHLDLFISSFLERSMKDNTLTPFLTFLEGILENSNCSLLLKDLYWELRNNSDPVHILNIVRSHSELFNESENICLTVFRLVKKYLISNDQDVKLKCFSILAKLNLPDELISHVVNIFISSMSDVVKRQQVIPYFMEFVRQIDNTKKMHVYKELIKIGQSLKVQSNSISLLFGCIIPELNNPKSIDEFFDTIENEENRFYVDSLLASVEQIYKVSNTFFAKSKKIVPCIFNQVSKSPNLVENLIKHIIKHLDNKQIKILASIVNSYMSYGKASVRKVCINVLIEMQKQKKLTPQIVQIDLYIRIVKSVCILLNDNMLKTEDVVNLYNSLDTKIADNIFSSDFDFNEYLGRYLNVNELFSVAMIRFSSICNKCQNIQLMANIIESWYKNGSFEKQYHHLINSKELTKYGFNLTVLAINSLNDSNAYSDPFTIPSKYMPKINLSDATIIDVANKLLNFNEREDRSEDNDGITYIYPFLIGYYNSIKMKRSGPLISIFEKICKLLHLKLADIPVRSATPQFSESSHGNSISLKTSHSLTGSFSKGSQKIQQMHRQNIERAFIDIGTMYSGKGIIGFPIEDKTVLELLLNISKKNPKFFVQQNITSIFYESDETMDIIDNVISNLSNDNDFIKFIRNMRDFYIEFKINNSNNIMPNNISTKIISRFLNCDDNYLYEIAMFFMAFFTFIREDVITNYALDIVRKMLSPLVNKFPLEHSSNIFTAISLFLPYISGHTYHIMTFMSCLNYLAEKEKTIDDDMECDLLTVVDAVLSSSANPQFILQVLLQRLNQGIKSLIILKAISHSLSFPTISLPQEFLSTIWQTVKKLFDKSDVKEIKFLVAKIGAEIINLCNNEDIFNICTSIFILRKANIDTLSIFISTLNSYDNLDENIFYDVEKYLPDTDKTIELIPIVPLLYKFNKITKFERLNFFVRGLLSNGYAGRMMCYKELRNLIPEIRSLNDNDAFIIVTGIYFAAAGSIQPSLSKYGKDTFRLILTEDYHGAEDPKVFRERYFNNLDSSVKQTIQKEYQIYD